MLSAHGDNNSPLSTGAYLRDLDAILQSARIDNGNSISRRLQAIIPVMRKMEILGQSGADCTDLKQHLFPIIEAYCAPHVDHDELAGHINRLRQAIAQAVKAPAARTG